MGNVLAVRPEPVEGSPTSTVNYNPDVLSCLANLSNDEVFTPPELVNQMLDMLPSDLWENQEAKFLDPVTKSGVFLREIAKRLNKGLAEQIPDQQARINHIFKHQLYGIAITELTSLLARRSLYCAKVANSELSVCDVFDDEQGNIRYQRIKHTWQNNKCTYCGASQEVYDREDALENHAYQFIHTDKPQKLFGKNMKFDVIVGNPPYQLSDGGAQASASPLYHKFVQQAKKLNPKYLTMIVPSRWFAGGKGLDEFRDEMLKDSSIAKLVDYPKTSDCFPGIPLKGGVCYFLKDSQYNGDCEIKTIFSNNISVMKRPLLEKGFDTLIRFNEAIPILRKVIGGNESRFNAIVSSRKPFGFSTDFSNYKAIEFEKSVRIFANKKMGYVDSINILQNLNWIGKHKIFISMAYGAGEDFPHQIINKPFIATPNSCCTETYLVVGPFQTKAATKNALRYMATKFFRFIVLLNKPTQHATSKVYKFVPMQDFNESWTDEKLYKKYGLTQEEIDFIESMIRPMELADE